MAEKTEIHIAVVVGDNRNAAACIYDGENTDWGFLSDSVGIYDQKTKTVNYQTSERRFIVKATVELPTIETIEAAETIPVE